MVTPVYTDTSNTTMSNNTLIDASKVQGTAVYNPKGDRLGTINDIMIEKQSGKAVYAIMSFGGFLGIGEDYHPIPWAKLKYLPSMGGYVVDLDARVLEDSPAYAKDMEPEWGDRTYEEGIHKHYGTAPYWASTTLP